MAGTTELTCATVLRWLVAEPTHGCDRAAAELLCQLLERVADGEPALVGGQTELSAPREGAAEAPVGRGRNSACSPPP
jgi:hypothetical protein